MRAGSREDANDRARRYCDEEYRTWVTQTAEHVIVRFRWDDDEGDDWIADWVTALPASEKDKYLTMVADGEGAQVEALLVRRFRQESRPAGAAAASVGRTARDLLAGAEARRAAREAAAARTREEARARRAAEQAAAYERHLEKLAGRKDETWQLVEKLTMFSKPKEYDQATQLLRDLHVIAQREDDITAFTMRVRELRTRYAKRPSLMERFDKAGLPRLEQPTGVMSSPPSLQQVGAAVPGLAVYRAKPGSRSEEALAFLAVTAGSHAPGT